MKDYVKVLGTTYRIVKVNHTEMEEGYSGFCDHDLHRIEVLDFKSCPEWCGESEEKIAVREKEVLRHEIVHAFFFESGLAESSAKCEAWAANEEMVDWFAIQGVKIYKAWEQAGAL